VTAAPPLAGVTMRSWSCWPGWDCGAGEVAVLQVGDVDWRAGEILIRGKADRHERLPLPADIGEALAGYPRRGRPRRPGRCLFLQARAPYAPLTSHAIRAIVARAAVRAGLRSASS